MLTKVRSGRKRKYTGAGLTCMRWTCFGTIAQYPFLHANTKKDLCHAQAISNTDMLIGVKARPACVCSESQEREACQHGADLTPMTPTRAFERPCALCTQWLQDECIPQLDISIHVCSWVVWAWALWASRRHASTHRPCVYLTGLSCRPHALMPTL